MTHAIGSILICMIHITVFIQICRSPSFRHQGLVLLACANKNVCEVNRTMMTARPMDNDGYLTMQIQVIGIMQKQINILKCRSFSFSLSLPFLVRLHLGIQLTIEMFREMD